jgi:uncharacterized protein (TIGR02118 family)
MGGAIQIRDGPDKTKLNCRFDPRRPELAPTMIIYTLLIEGESPSQSPQETLSAPPLDAADGACWAIENLVISDVHLQPLPPTGMKVQRIFQVAFAELAALRAFHGSEGARAWRNRLSGEGLRCLPMLMLRNETLPRPPVAEGSQYVKRMGILQRQSELSADAFRRWWLEVHGPVAARLPGLKGYFQNLTYDVLGLESADSRGPLRCDGFTELWFNDTAAMEQAFPLRTNTSVTRHANSHIAAISTLIVRETVLR